jgi:CubicO group peptidase (beta-lactamase class C family)
MLRKIYTLLAACAVTAFAGGAGAPQPNGWPEIVDGYRRALHQAGIVGSSLMVVRDGRIVARQNEGLQNLDARELVTNDTIYHWASITKTLTGIAIMQLRDRGLLSLDDSVVKYVPELRLAHNPFGDISQVKIRHLMSHSAGFRASTWPWGGDKPWHPFEPTSWEQIVAMLPYTDVQFAPGSKYSYSNPGVIFLGRIIQLLSGDDYEIYVTKNIVMPLGMRSTFFDRAPYYLLPHRSHSFFRDDKGLREARFDFDTGITVSNGGLNSPFEDMAKYLAFLIGAAESRDRTHTADHAESAGYDTVLKRSSLEEMWRPQIRAVEGEGVSGNDSQAALSFFVERYGGVELVGHSGDQNGFISHLYLHRPSRTAWLVSMNTDTAASPDGTRLGSRQVDTAVRELMLTHVIR